MRPTLNKNKTDIYQGAASKVEEDEKLVASIGDYIFEDLKNKMSEFDGYCFYMYKLGMFKIRAFETEKYLKKLENMKNMINSNEKIQPDRIEIVQEDLQKRIDKVRARLDEYYKILDRKKEIKQQIKDEQINGNIQQQETDLGRNEE